MRLNSQRNQTTYNLTEHRQNSPIDGDFQKGILKNLRGQSPFKEGQRNKDWISPTNVSNVVFYNHGNETSSNHHAQPKAQNKKGFDLNHYVAYDVQMRTETSTQNQTGVSARQRDEGRKSPAHQSIIRISSEQRVSVERSRSHAPSERRGSINVQQTNPGQSETHLQNGKTGQLENSQRVVSSSPVHQSQRSVIVDRKYDRSKRSASVSRDEQAGKTKSVSQETMMENKYTQAVVEETVNQQETGQSRVQRSRSVVAIPNQRPEYLKPTMSNISNPDNLVCDNCVNKNLNEVKLNIAQNFRREETELANRLKEVLLVQDQNERQHKRMKTQLYQNTITQQLEDHQQRQQVKQAQEKAEQMKIQQMLADYDQSGAMRQQQLQQQKQRYAGELEEQTGLIYEARQRKYLQETERDQMNGNLLINDQDRDSLRRGVKERHQTQIREQMLVQMDLKNKQRQIKSAENDAYRVKVQEMINQDIDARKRLEKQKKDAFVADVNQNLQQRVQVRGGETLLKNAELEIVNRKIEEEDGYQRNKAIEKKTCMMEYIKTLGNQIADKNEQKLNDLKKERQVFGGTLLLPEKHDRCFNCAKCRHQFTLKHLNKLNKLGKGFK